MTSLDFRFNWLLTVQDQHRRNRLSHSVSRIDFYWGIARRLLLLSPLQVRLSCHAVSINRARIDFHTFWRLGCGTKSNPTLVGLESVNIAQQIRLAVRSRVEWRWPNTEACKPICRQLICHVTRTSQLLPHRIDLHEGRARVDAN